MGERRGGERGGGEGGFRKGIEISNYSESDISAHCCTVRAENEGSNNLRAAEAIQRGLGGGTEGGKEMAWAPHCGEGTRLSSGRCAQMHRCRG